MSEFLNRVSRTISRRLSREMLPPLQKSIISFSFDDCPKSAIETALPIMEAEDWRATIYVACGLCEIENHLGKHMSLSDVVDVHDRGHEIADHTYSHVSPEDVSLRDYLEDIEKNQSALKALGLPESRHFAFPYGHVSPSLKKALSKKFLTLRGVMSPKIPQQDANLLKAVRVYSGDWLEAALQHIEDATTSPQWLNLFTHDVRENPSEYGCTPKEFEKLVMAVKDSGLPVMTVDGAYRAIQDMQVSS